MDEELKHMRDTHSNDSLDLDSLQSRQYLIKKLYRKYGGSYTSLMESKRVSLIRSIESFIGRMCLTNWKKKKKNRLRRI